MKFFPFVFVSLVLSFLLFSSGALAAKSYPIETVVHPYHVGSLEIRHNSKTKTFELIGKFFVDDLENGISKDAKSSVFFLEPKHKAKMNSLLKAYLLKNVKLQVNGKTIPLQFIGYEEESEAVVVYLESSVVSEPSKVEAEVSVLYNLFDDQLNIIHLIVEGKRKSLKLYYPLSSAKAQF